ncbi:MAG: hypothetical protein M0Q88_00085 [Bacilli bacterium]|nr:hypothetical protein [Bacilli bacterium]
MKLNKRKYYKEKAKFEKKWLHYEGQNIDVAFLEWLKPRLMYIRELSKCSDNKRDRQLDYLIDLVDELIITSLNSRPTLENGMNELFSALRETLTK